MNKNKDNVCPFRPKRGAVLLLIRSHIETESMADVFNAMARLKRQYVILQNDENVRLRKSGALPQNNCSFKTNKYKEGGVPSTPNTAKLKATTVPSVGTKIDE